LYYLNSRYYDAEVGRFINAEAFIGANGGILGYNMFAYCNNNPVAFADPTGCVLMNVCGFDVTSSQHLMMRDYGGLYTGGGGGGAYIHHSELISSKVKEDIENFNIFNDDPEVALDSNYFSCYKGILVIRTDLKRSGSFGVIFLTHESNGRDNPADIVRHEYGHVIQLLQLGVINYALCIGIPSAGKWGDDDYYGDYYNKPFEVTADIYGGVQSRSHTFRDSYAGFKYLATSAVVGPIVWLSIE
jgi:hypothetical protein